MEKYNSKTIKTRDPRYLFYIFSAAHFLRATDSLITIIDTMTNWSVSYAHFKVVVTGHSKFGQACFTTAAADPQRVSGIMPSGCASIDSAACRILGKYQGAVSTKPDASFSYLGTMMRYFVEPLDLQDEMNPDIGAMITLGTDDDKNRSEGYTPKYTLTVCEKGLNIPYRIGCIPNAPHTTRTPFHSVYWRMWLAHTFLDRELCRIDTVGHTTTDDSITVTSSISGAQVQEIRVWATDQSDLDTSSWDGFLSYSMSGTNGVYQADIPLDSTAYVIEIVDTQSGIISSPPIPVNDNYFNELLGNTP